MKMARRTVNIRVYESRDVNSHVSGMLQANLCEQVSFSEKPL